MGFKSVFDSEAQNWYFTDGNIKGTTTNINGVQYINLKRKADHVANILTVETSWHKRLGHISWKKLKRLSTKLPYITCESPKTNCDICLTSKAKRNIFRDAPPSTSEVLGRIHSDVCGPFEPDFEGNKYFITFIDEFSRNCSLSTFRSRDMVVDLIKQYINWAENQTGLSVKIFISDNGKEYICSDVKSYFKEKGIDHIQIPSYSPQCNGIAERKNQSLCMMARSLVKEANLNQKTSQKVWSLAIKQANFIQNRVHSDATGKIPLNVFYENERKAYLKHVKRFGSLVYVHDHKMSKFAPRATKGMLAGQT